MVNDIESYGDEGGRGSPESAATPPGPKKQSRRGFLRRAAYTSLGGAIPATYFSRNAANAITSAVTLADNTNEPISRFHEVAPDDIYADIKHRLAEGCDGILIHDNAHTNDASTRGIVEILKHVPQITDYFFESPVEGQGSDALQQNVNLQSWRKANEWMHSNRNPEPVHEKEKMPTNLPLPEIDLHTSAERELGQLLVDRNIAYYPTDNHKTPNGWAADAIMDIVRPQDPNMTTRLIRQAWAAAKHGDDLPKSFKQAIIERNEHMAAVIANTMTMASSAPNKPRKFIFCVGSTHLVGDQNVQHFLKSKSKLQWLEVEVLAVDNKEMNGKCYIQDRDDGEAPKLMITFYDRFGRHVNEQGQITHQLHQRDYSMGH